MTRRRSKTASGTAHFWRHASLPFVEARTAYDATACYRLHTHPTLSVGIIDQGEAVMTLGDRQVLLRAGDVVVISPDVVHSCNPRTARWSYRMFYLDSTWAKRVLHRALGGTEFPEWKTPVRTLRARTAFEAMSRAISTPATPQEIEAGLERSVRAILLGARASLRRVPRSDGSALAQLRRYLDTHLDRKVTLAELAAIARVSTFAVLRGFRREYGLTPHGYQLDRRINQARELLRRGTRSAEAAYLTGFADQSHLHRCFRARVATTPRKFQVPANARE